jgi:hypothetical protein
MAKSFKKFREDYYDDEWSNDESEIDSKEKRLQNRRDKRKKKVAEQHAIFDENDQDDG